MRRSVHNAASPGLRITSPSSKFARRERISHTENDTYHVIPAAGGKTLKGKSLKNNEINCWQWDNSGGILDELSEVIVFDKDTIQYDFWKEKIN